jgi:hypothetical protein
MARERHSTKLGSRVTADEKEKEMRQVFAYGGIAASLILVAFGIGAIAIGIDGRNEVRDAIAEQSITATPDAPELTNGELEPRPADQDGRRGEGIRRRDGASRA